jgi:hypothetical protein
VVVVASVVKSFATTNLSGRGAILIKPTVNFHAGVLMGERRLTPPTSLTTSPERTSPSRDGGKCCRLDDDPAGGRDDDCDDDDEEGEADRTRTYPSV